MKRNEKGQFVKGGRIDITNEKFGRLTCIEFDHMEGKKSFWKFRCECGNEIIKRKDMIKAMKYPSCGCWQSELKSKYMYERHESDEHHESKTRLYNIYQGAKSRCENEKDNSYDIYGGRGIEFKWKSYIEFKNDMYESYIEHCKLHGEENTTIDRINVNGNYCKENCRWATIKEQARNRRTNINVVIKNGDKVCLKEYSEMINNSYNDLLYKYNKSIYVGTKEVPYYFFEDNTEVND